MSASRERKKRMVESEQAAPQQAKKTKKKLSEGWIFAIIVILIPVIVFGVIFGVQASWRNATVVSVGDHKVSTTEFNYFYRGALNSIYSTYGSYISLLGIDTSTPLDEQSYAGSDEYDTWADFLADSAKTSAVDAYTVYDKAVEAGFSLSDDDKASIDNEINTLKTYAGVYSMDLDEYIEAMFGKGCNEKNYRHYLEVSKLHDAYIESLTYTEDERNAVMSRTRPSSTPSPITATPSRPPILRRSPTAALTAPRPRPPRSRPRKPLPPPVRLPTPWSPISRPMTRMSPS